MKRFAFRLFHHTLSDRDYIEVKAHNEDEAREKAWGIFKAFGIHYSGHSLVSV